MKTLPTMASAHWIGLLDVTAFTNRLRQLREDRGLTQTRVAELLQISPRVYNRWEKGGAVPRLDTLVRIADLLQVSLDELAGRTEDLSKVRVRNPKLHDLYQQIDDLPDEDQKALVILLDSLVKRSQVGSIMAR